MLTLKKLKGMKPDTIFAKGTLTDSPNDINLANTDRTLKWIAVRGNIHDWAIYCQPISSTPLEWDWERIRSFGDKIHMENHVKKLVPCDTEAFKMYRH